jgi:hypothetical protein
MIECKECGKLFKNERALHCHIKEHDMYMADYYTKHYPRFNKLTGEPMPFKNKESYFEKDFNNSSQLNEWCQRSGDSIVSQYILEKLKQRVSSKGLKRGPGHLELKINGLPSLDQYIRCFGSYSSACEKIGINPLFFKRMPKDFTNCDTSGIKIFIDTREQKPLRFKNSEVMALDAGDYTAAGEFYDRTYIDRKSPSDLISTLSLKNLDRFRAELNRISNIDSYLFVVVESSLEYIEKYLASAKRNKFGPHKTSSKFIYHNMREICHEFSDRCQFIFSGSREKSEMLIPKILFFGSILWNVDMQYYLDKDDLG